MTVEIDETEKPSLAQAIADLGIGKTHALAERIDNIAATKEAIQDCTNRLRNAIAPAVARAKKRSKGEFTVETGMYFTRTLDIIVTAAITRTA